MRARSNPWLAVLSVLAGCGLALMASSAGCGGKTVDGPGAQPDTGSADTSARDTAAETAAQDTDKQYDVPGTLFDVDLPDMQFDGGKTLGGCYSCTTDRCRAEVAECDKDARCRGLVLCGMVECAGKFDDFGCIIDCATRFDVASAEDPVVAKAYAVGNCVGAKCADACPVPTDAGPDSRSDADAASDVSADSDARTDAMTDTADGAADAPPDARPDADARETEVSAFMIYPGGRASEGKPMDAKLAEGLRQLFVTLGAIPEVRKQLIEQYSAPH